MCLAIHLPLVAVSRGAAQSCQARPPGPGHGPQNEGKRMSEGAEQADAIVVGAGLAGLAATAVLAEAGKRVLLIEQEPEQSLGGQAHWSLGGLFLVASPEQRRMGVRDSAALALQDWMGTAGFDRSEDVWPRKWAEAY